MVKNPLLVEVMVHLQYIASFTATFWLRGYFVTHNNNFGHSTMNVVKRVILVGEGVGWM